MKCKKCAVSILFPDRPFALVQDDSFCSEFCFSFFYLVNNPGYKTKEDSKRSSFRWIIGSSADGDGDKKCGKTDCY